MKLLIFYINNLFRKIPLKIFIYVQIIIAVCSINLTLGMFEYSNQFITSRNSEAFISGVVILPAFNEAQDYKNIDNIYADMHSAFSKLPGVKSIDTISQTGVISLDKNNGIQVYSFSRGIFSYNKIDLKSGSKAEVGFSDGINNVFASEGSEFTLGNEYTLNVITKNGEDVLKFKIIGVLYGSSKLFSLNVGGTGVSLNNFYGVTLQKRCIVGIDLKNLSGNALDISPNPGVVALLNKDQLLKDLKYEWDGAIGSYAQYKGVPELVKEQKSKNLEKGKVQFSIGAILVFMCLIGMCSSSIIKILNETREYGIYYLCGSKWGKCIVINMFSNIVDIFLPFSIGLILAKIFTLNPYSKALISFNNIIISFFIILSFFIITGLWSVIYLSKTSPIGILRRNKQ